MRSWWKRLVTQFSSQLPPEYLRGFRRLANSATDIEKDRCFTCRNAIGFVTWHCSRAGQGCKWEPCFIRSELTWRDRYSDKWIGMPDNVGA